MPKLRSLFVATTLLFAPSAFGQTDLPLGFVAKPIGSDWHSPVGLAFAGPGEMLVAERQGTQWLEHGNGIIWTGQEPFSEYLFANGATDVAGAGDHGLDDILDSATPGIGGGSGTMAPALHARELPSFQEYFAWKALRYAQLGPAWHVDRCYGADGVRESDVIAVRHRSGGFYAQFYCTFHPDVPRINVIREFIQSYVLHMAPTKADLRRQTKY